MTEKAAAWLGLLGLVAGFVVFVVFAWPAIRGDIVG